MHIIMNGGGVMLVFMELSPSTQANEWLPIM